MNKEGKINLSFWACREMLPDPEFYRECLLQSYDELYEVTVAKAKAKAKAKKKRKRA
jgi:hypothetical protein